MIEMEAEAGGLPAVFLDRDGVINFNRADYVKSWDEFVFMPGSLEAMRLLAQLNMPVIVVTNQSAIGRGLVSCQTVEEINARMVAAVRSAGGRIDEVFFCPHRPDERCACRKPEPGMLIRAAATLRLDLKRSFLIGDGESDMLAAQAAGSRPVLVRTGRGAEQLALLQRHGSSDYEVFDDLAQAVTWIRDQVLAPGGSQGAQGSPHNTSSVGRSPAFQSATSEE